MKKLQEKQSTKTNAPSGNISVAVLGPNAVLHKGGVIANAALTGVSEASSEKPLSSFPASVKAYGIAEGGQAAGEIRNFNITGLQRDDGPHTSSNSVKSLALREERTKKEKKKHKYYKHKHHKDKEKVSKPTAPTSIHVAAIENSGDHAHNQLEGITIIGYIGKQKNYGNVPSDSLPKKEDIQKNLKAYYQSTDAYIHRVFQKSQLPILKCFIHVAIVDKKEQGVDEQKLLQPEKEKKLEAKETFLKRQQLYASYENIYKTKQKRLIKPEALFDPQAHRKVVRRLLMVGRAGIGKTILSQYLSYLWSSPERKLWQEKFDWVFKLKLRNLTANKYSKNVKLVDVLLKECFNLAEFTVEKENALKQSIAHFIEKSPERILMILDGYDELNRSEYNPCIKIIEDVLIHQKFYVLVSTRPFTDIQENNFDDILECIGFADEDIPRFIQFEEVCSEPEKQNEILTFLNQSPAVKSLMHVPLMLDILCGFWVSELFQKQNMTMTALYEHLMHQLWGSYGKNRGGGFSRKKRSSIERKTKGFLGLLAFNGMEDNKILFERQRVEKALKEIYPGRGDSTVDDYLQPLLDTGFLNSSQNLPQEKSYYFPHLTFQEFFAAQYIAQELKHNNSEIIQIIRRKKYYPRYEVMWWFTAGLLKEKTHRLKTFFNLLEKEPADVIGLSSTLLGIRCLEESELKASKVGKLLGKLIDWISYEINKECTLSDITHYLDLSPRIFAHKDVSQYYQKLLSDESTKVEIRQTTAHLLREQKKLPEPILSYLVNLLRNENEEWVTIATKILCEQEVVPDSILKLLINLFQDDNLLAWGAAKKVLSKQIMVPDSVLKLLINLLPNGNIYASSTAMTVLDKQKVLPECALQTLADYSLQDSDEGIRKSAAEILGKQLALPEGRLIKLVALLEDNNDEIKIASAEALGRQLALPEPILKSLLVLLQNEERIIRCLVTEVLGKQTTLPECILKLLNDSLGDNNNELLRISSVEVLGKQRALPGWILKSLSDLIRSAPSSIRHAAAMALGKQLAFQECVFSMLSDLSSNTDENVRVAVAEALGRQQALTDLSLRLLAKLLEDKDMSVKRAAIETSGQQQVLPEWILSLLVNLLNSKEGDVKNIVVEALCHQQMLPEWVLSTLVNLVSTDEFALLSVAEILCQQQELSEPILTLLNNFLHSKDERLRIAAAKALAKQTALLEPILKSLVDLLQATNSVISVIVTDILYKQTELPTPILISLVNILRSNDARVSAAVAKVLSRQPTLSDSVLESMNNLLQDENKVVKIIAAETLSNQTRLPESTLNLLGILLQDNEVDVKKIGIEVLGKQKRLPEWALKSLCDLIQSDNDDGVKAYAAVALCQQPEQSETVLELLWKFIKRERFYGSNSTIIVMETLGKKLHLPIDILEKICSFLMQNPISQNMIYLVTKGLPLVYLVQQIFQNNQQKYECLYYLLSLKCIKEKIALYFDDSNCLFINEESSKLNFDKSTKNNFIKTLHQASYRLTAINSFQFASISASPIAPSSTAPKVALFSPASSPNIHGGYPNLPAPPTPIAKHH